MKVSVDELVDRVKANMEELTDSFDADIVMTAGIGVERYIREKMPDALLAVWATEPVSSLPLTDCASLLRPQRSSVADMYFCPMMCGVWLSFVWTGGGNLLRNLSIKRLPNMSCSSIFIPGEAVRHPYVFYRTKKDKNVSIITRFLHMSFLIG